MKIPMTERRVLIKNHAKAYQSGKKSEKSEILDHFVKATGYNRRHAARVLRNHGKSRHVGNGVVLVGDAVCGHRRGRGRE